MLSFKQTGKCSEGVSDRHCQALADFGFHLVGNDFIERNGHVTAELGLNQRLGAIGLSLCIRTGEIGSTTSDGEVLRPISLESGNVGLFLNGRCVQRLRGVIATNG